MIYFQKLSFYHLKKAFVPLSIRLLNRYHLSVYEVLFTVCQGFCFHGCMLNFIKMFSASLKWLYLSHQSVKIQITSLIFKNTKPNLYSWCEYIVMMPVLDLVHQYFLKIFVSIFTSQISLNIPFTFARWVFSSLSQNGFTTSIFYLWLLRTWLTDQGHIELGGGYSRLEIRSLWTHSLFVSSKLHSFCEHSSRLQNQLLSSWMFWKHKGEGTCMIRVIAASSLWGAVLIFWFTKDKKK